MYVAKLGDLYFKKYTGYSAFNHKGIDIEFSSEFYQAFIFDEMDKKNSTINQLYEMGFTFYEIKEHQLEKPKFDWIRDGPTERRYAKKEDYENGKNNI